MKPEVFTLKNGLRVIFINTKAFPTLTTILFVGAGSRYENEKNNGVAHFFEHMAFKGGKKYSNTFIISSTIEGLGGVFNAFTAKDHTGYWIKSPAEHFETVVDVLSDMVLHPLLKEEEIEREKGVIIEEINMYEDTPQRKVSDIFENLLYRGNSLGYDIAGKKETVKNFSRKTFVDYMQQLYQPKNAVLVVAGGLGDEFEKARYRVSHSSGSPPDVRRGIPSRSKQVSSPSLPISASRCYLDIIEKKFSHWKNGQRSSFEKITENQSQPQVLIKYKKTEQTHFCLGFRAFSFNDQRKYALSLLATILGGGMSSRLFIEVRERRGLCYYISCHHELYYDVGYMVTQAGVANNIDKIKEAIEVILKEHNKIKKLQIPDFKFQIKKAKELLKGRLLLSLEDSFNVASFFGTKKILEDKLETPQQVIEKLEKVTAEEIADLASQIFKPERLNLAMIGPFRSNNFLPERFLI